MPDGTPSLRLTLAGDIDPVSMRCPRPTAVPIMRVMSDLVPPTSPGDSGGNGDA